MKHPAEIDRPFFAYGLFRPGQLAFFRLRGLVSKTNPAHIVGSLLVRHGLPILDPEGHGRVKGALLTFVPEHTGEAYTRILDIEPDRHYRWHEARVDGEPVNVLVGRSPQKGSVRCEDEEWNGWSDPLFTVALDVVEETLTSSEFQWDLKPLFRLQMAYLLLWSSIERYASLRYHLGDKVMDKIMEIAEERAFAAGLLQHVNDRRDVYRADQPDKKEVLDPHSPQKSLRYYYQVRSNVAHRGKAVVRDYELVKNALIELLPIFREVVKAAERDAKSNNGSGGPSRQRRTLAKLETEG